jgi:hypothetical protein
MNCNNLGLLVTEGCVCENLQQKFKGRIYTYITTKCRINAKTFKPVSFVGCRNLIPVSKGNRGNKNALAAWHSGHCIRLQNRRSWV